MDADSVDKLYTDSKKSFTPHIFFIVPILWFLVSEKDKFCLTEFFILAKLLDFRPK